MHILIFIHIHTRKDKTLLFEYLSTGGRRQHESCTAKIGVPAPQIGVFKGFRLLPLGLYLWVWDLFKGP